MSAYTGDPLPEGQVCIGEVGLSGEIRPVSQMDLRLKESAKLGFTSAVVPALKDSQIPNLSISVKHLRELHQLVRPMIKNKAA